MAEPIDVDDPRDLLVAAGRRYAQFCLGDPARYQLLFQRTLPGFEPSPASYAPAVRALDGLRRLLVLNGVHDPRHIDLWTALFSGLVSQQVANDPGGVRWTGLVDEATDMFLSHCRPAARRESELDPLRAEGGLP